MSAPPKLLRLTADRREAGSRLDLFLIAAVPDLSRKRAKRLIDERRVSVNGRIEPMASRTLSAGDRVEVRFPEEAHGAAAMRPPEVRILYKDDQCVALDKPPGLPSGPTKDARRPHAQRLAEEALGERLTLLHRLDRDTSGVLLLARTPAFAEALLADFRERRVEKTYLALASGRTPERFEEVCHLKEAGGGRVVVTGAGGMRAETSFRTLAYDKAADVSLLEAQPRTGRMHQIRVHLAKRGHPILGDSLYGGLAAVKTRAGELAPPRQMLHAWRLSFPHPATGGPFVVESPIPGDFAKIADAVFGAWKKSLEPDGVR